MVEKRGVGGVGDHVHHIKHLKRHRNVLYGIVFVLLVLQMVTLVFISAQTSKIILEQEFMKDDVEGYVSDLENKIEDSRQESQFGINAISRQIARQQRDIELEIGLLKSSQEDFSDVIDHVIKGVVSITTDRSAGSGFVVDAGGYVVTNYHVIRNAKQIQVNTFNGKIYGAEVIGFNQTTEIALLRIPGVFDKIELANSDEVQLGEKVIAIGNPLGLSFTVTEGIVSAVDRVGPNGLFNYIQTDVTLNPGNSGGPLINREGKVIGINNFKIGGAEGLGFALESDKIREDINLIANRTLI